MSVVERWIDSPVGKLRLIADDSGLLGVFFEEHAHPREYDVGPETQQPRAARVLDAAQSQLDEYFRGTRRDFDLPLSPSGTEMQRSVWAALSQIPFGGTRSYGALAASIGRPSAARAVGAANGRNPISIIVPCHRVVGASGALTGYAGGVHAKAWLLAHEAAS